MATATFDGQSFAIDGRRVWIVGAGIEYARVHPDAWADRIAAARQAGFNTIATSCPWLLHEPRKGRFSFTEWGDVRRFVELCGQAGMWVLLRPGPYVGNGYDAGGLPSWIVETPGIRLRQASEPFLERVSVYFRKLLAELTDLQVTGGGPILLVQSEHAWLCANDKQAEKYLLEITRYIRENGIAVPIINTNDLWQEAAGTIDTWRGRDDLLVHLRQLRSVQPGAPRLVSELGMGRPGVWGEAIDESPRPASVMHLLAQVLAAGAQPVVAPFHGGTSFGFAGGRLGGRNDGFVTTSVAPAAPLGEAGERGPRYRALKRIATFASHFGHVFAELDPDYHPIALDLGDAEGGGGGAKRERHSGGGGGAGAGSTSVVSLRGGAGQVVFVFADAPLQKATLLLEHGVRMPVALGDQTVGWYLLDVDLRGAGRLDYANLCPVALVDRTILVLQGPAGTPAYVSIDGSPFEATVPEGGTPLVSKHKRVTLVIANQQQIDQVACGDRMVFSGVEGLDGSGQPIAAKRGATVLSISSEDEPEKVPAQVQRSGSRAVEVTDWQAVPSETYTSGGSPRFATLDGPQTLAACGAPQGYGWYRVRFVSGATKKHRLHLPHAADRVHLFVDGQFQRVVGVGKGAECGPFEVQVAKGERAFVALVDNFGRFSEGNDFGEPKGLYGHVHSVKKLTGVKAGRDAGKAVDPFTLRGYIAGCTRGHLSDPVHAAWKFAHTRSTPVLVDIDGARASGTMLLNDEAFAYYAGATGSCLARYLLGRDTTPALKRGGNVLRFAPDPRQEGAIEDLIKATSIYECAEVLSEGATWAFAKWEPPGAVAWEPASRAGAKSLRGTPTWWRGFFAVGDAVEQARVELSGLSKGHVFVNGEDLGRYFTATGDGTAVGPQEELLVPGAWLRPGDRNELVLFDEHGFAPWRVRVRLG